MRLINRKNFISITCISFTLIVMVKLIAEKIMGFTDENYSGNIFVCLLISVLVTFILALHYYLQNFPFIPVFIAQYILVTGLALGMIKIMGSFTDIAKSAYRDMIISVTIPFIVCAIVYYISFYRQIRKANEIIERISEQQV